MLNIVSLDLSSVLVALAFYLTFVISASIIFKFLWIDKLDFCFPRGRYKILRNNTETIKVTNLSEFITVMWELLYELDVAYWIEYIGLEGINISPGYSYVYFLRNMISVFGLYSIFWGSFFLITYIGVMLQAGTT